MESIKTIPKDALVYLDESGIDDNEHYLYSWGLRGQRVHMNKKAFRKKRLSIVAALNNNELKALFVYDGYCNT